MHILLSFISVVIVYCSLFKLRLTKPNGQRFHKNCILGQNRKVSYLLSSSMDITVDRAKDLYSEFVSRPIMCKLFKNKTLFNNKICK